MNLIQWSFSFFFAAVLFGLLGYYQMTGGVAKLGKVLFALFLLVAVGLFVTGLLLHGPVATP